MDDSKVSILIVDDKPEKLLSLEAVLEDLGQNIVRAYSGREALRHVLNEDFAVILLDVNMPDIDGFETAQLIRQRKNSAHVPIIFLTAMSDEMHVSRGYSLGAVDYILTPVVPQVLRSKVAVFVDLFKKTQQVQLQAERLRQRAKQLHRLTGASLAINSAQTVQKIVQIATETARELIGVHQAIMIATAGHHPAHSASFASYTDKHAAWRGKVPKLQALGVHAMVCGTNQPIRMTPTELEAHSPSEANGQEPEAPPLRGLLAAPLCARDGQNIGLILLSDSIDDAFTDDDQAILVQLAQMASVAIENTIFAEDREANRLKDEFLSTLSHELRTPLNAIAGWVQLLKMEPVEGEFAHGLDVIERNVTAQTKLIEDLLDLSRITSGKLRLNARPTPIKAVVEAAVEALRPLVHDKNINIDRELVADDAVILGDPDRLQQVLSNLLNNAAKFTPAGGRITVRLNREGSRVRLSIIDTGVGIDPEFLPHVFDRFRQADSTSSRRHGGLGIGLTIVQHIVSLHRGSVQAHSEGKGRGSTFTVTLPLAAVTQDHTHSPATPGDPRNQDLPSLRDLRVLLVDDEPDARDVVAQIVQRNGANVMTAASVAEALDRLPAFHPDVVVTDLAMPEEDGFALLRQVRRLPNPQDASLPVIALTAYARPEDQAQVFESGFQAHLAKPVDPNDLVITIHRFARHQDKQLPLPPNLGVILPTQTEIRIGA